MFKCPFQLVSTPIRNIFAKSYYLPVMAFTIPSTSPVSSLQTGSNRSFTLSIHALIFGCFAKMSLSHMVGWKTCNDKNVKGCPCWFTCPHFFFVYSRDMWQSILALAQLPVAARGIGAFHPCQRLFLIKCLALHLECLARVKFLK